MTEGEHRSRRWQRVRGAVTRRFRIDTYTLAIFRICLGTLLLADLLFRARNLVVFYTDRGVLPIEVLAELYSGYRFLSVHALSGAIWFQILLFLLAAIAATAVLVGYRTRLATALSLVMLVSLQARNPMVLNAGDPLFRRLLFWSVFLPLGASWSVDARLTEQRWTTVNTVASAGLLLQVVIVYLATLGFKLQGRSWLAGNAVRRVFALDSFTIRFGEMMAEVPALLVTIDWIWLALLAASPLLVLSAGRQRTMLASLFVLMHLGMALTMHLGLFPAISIVALVPFFGSVIEDRTLPAALNRTLDTIAEWLPAGPRVGSFSTWQSHARAVVSVVLIGLLVLFVALNAIALGVVAAPPGTPSAATDRSWDMFAPAPPGSELEIVATGTLESGAEVNISHPASFQGTAFAAARDSYSTARVHKYATTLRDAPPLARAELAGYLCSQWNRSHSENMVTVRIGALVEETRLHGPDRTSRTSYGRYACQEVTSSFGH